MLSFHQEKKKEKKKSLPPAGSPDPTPRSSTARRRPPPSEKLEICFSESKMKFTDVAAMATLASTATADVIKIPVARSPAGSNTIARRRNPRLTKRASVTESLVNNVTAGSYFASLSVGTPGQTQSMALDTGSSDAWVVSSDAPLCTEKRLQIYYGTECGTTCEMKLSTYLESV